MYIRPNGALGYTQAHSSSIPTGSLVAGFTYTPGTNFGTFGINLPGAAGLLACPTGKNFSGPYQVFANIKNLRDKDVPGGKINKCLGFNALAGAYEGVGAWQYT